jgi:hypothetical protein
MRPSCPHVCAYNAYSTGKDKWLEERISVRGVPLHEQRLSICAILGPLSPSDIAAQTAGGYSTYLQRNTTAASSLVPPLSTGMRSRTSCEVLFLESLSAVVYRRADFPEFLPGPFVRDGQGDTQGSLVLLSDYSLVTIEATIEYAAYVPSELKHGHVDAYASMKGPRVQVCLEQAPSTNTDQHLNGGGVGGRDSNEIDPQIVYTTAAADSVTHPNWGETCAMSLSWGACRRAALRFRLLPASPSVQSRWMWNLGECQV